MKIATFFLIFLLQAIGGFAQNVKNPNIAQWTSPDHNLATAYEIDIIDTINNSVIQTITISNVPVIPLNTNGEVETKINVQPIKFGTYIAKVRVVFGAVKSEDSPPSNVWERTPQSATNVKVSRQ